MGQLGGFGGAGGFGGPSAVGGGYVPGDRTALGSNFTPWVSLLGTYTRTLSDPIRVGPSWRDSYFGGAGNWGIGGGRRYRGTALAGQYAGAVTYLPTTTVREKTRFSHVGSLGLEHSLTGRLTLSASFMGGTSIGGYGMGSGFGGFGAFGGNAGYGPDWLAANPVGASNAFGDPAANGLVDQDLYGLRTNFYSTAAGLGYRVNRGLTVGGGGGAYVVRRGALMGLNGTFYNGFASYVFDSRNDISFIATRSTQDYRNSLSGVKIDGYAGSYGRRLGPRTHLRLVGGVNQLRSSYIGVVALDPALAAIVGAGSSLQLLKYDKLSPTVSASLTHAWEKSGVALRYFRGITPGNDLFFAGQRESVSGSYSYTGIARTSVRATAAYYRSRNDLVRTSIAKAENYLASLALGYYLGRGFNASFSAGYRHGRLETSTNRSDVFAGVGISYSPGGLPFVR